MPRIPFSELPDDARLWVFPLSRPLTPQEEGEVRSQVDTFLDDWAAHESPLTAGRDWVEDRFLMVAVDEAHVPPSGCSIDSLARSLRELGARLGMSFLDHGPIWFRRDGALQSLDRGAFKSSVQSGDVDLETPVLDTAITRLSQFRSGEWEKPAGTSWHRRAFFPKENA